MIKKNYENPESELLVVRFEDNFCQTGPYGAKNSAGTQLTEEEDYTYSY